MTTVIDHNEALALLTEAVKIKGADHVQEACYYVQEGDGRGESECPADHVQPTYGCMVGTALALKFGIDTLSEALTIDADERTGLNGELFANEAFQAALTERLDVEFTPGAFRVFVTAQDVQDGRRKDLTYSNGPWGVALREASTVATMVSMGQITL